MNNYLIAVGGTGQHVALCLVDYLALAQYTTDGSFPAATDDWKIILIDADQEKSQQELSAWAWCRLQVERLAAAGLSIEAVAHRPVEDMGRRFGDTTPASLIAALSESLPDAEIFVDLLFTPNQAKVPVLDGFFGEPRVASFIGGRWLREVTGDVNHDLGALAGQIAAGAGEVRVGLAGSSAGGTGAGLIDPLRRWLVGISGEAAGTLCVDIGLEWFQIEGKNNNALSTRMRHNAASCLFPFLKPDNPHRLAIWGHPSVASATVESDQSNTRQAAKTNLTLPWYGASVLVDFYSSADMPRTATIATDRVSLSDLLTPLHNFAGLIEANRRVLGRLRHTHRYLQNPYSGSVLPFPPFRHRGRVPALDAADPEVATRILRLVEAKTSALERLSRSELENHTAAIDIGSRPVYSTAALKRLYPTAADPALCSESMGTAEPTGSTQGRLLPEHALPAERAANAAIPRGSLGALSQSERTGLGDLDLIAATRIPSLSGVRDLISAFLELPSEELWTGCLAERQKPIMPAVLRRPTDDRVRDWMRRWLLAARALMSGALQCHSIEEVPGELIDDLERAAVDVEGILVWQHKGRRYVVGGLDPDFVVIPSVGKLWETEDALRALNEQAGGISRLLTWSKLATRFIGRGRAPNWARLLRQEFGEGMALELKATGSIEMRWLGEEILNIPLPSDSGNKRLEIAMQEQDGGGDDREPPAEVPADLQRLMIGGEQVYLRKDLRRAFGENFHGAVIVDPRGRSISLEGARQLEEDDFFTPVVVQLRNCPVSYSVPVTVSCAPYVASCSYAMSGSSLKATITLRNEAGTTIEKKYTTEQILNDSKHLTSLYLWPSVAEPTQRGLWTLVSRDGRLDRDLRILTSPGAVSVSGDDTATVVNFPSPITIETDWLQLAKRQRMSRVVPPHTAPDRRPSLVAVRIDLGAGSGAAEAGLIPYMPSRPQASQWADERWCVDFGTSSTVVAVRRNRDDRVDGATLRIRGEADSTIAALSAVSVKRKDMRWYDTWDGQGPITQPLAGEMPSHVLVLPGGAGRPEPELGTDYAVDLGWTITGAHLGGDVQVRERLKWTADPLRAAYNRDVLEAMLQIRQRTAGKLPPSLKVTFTVPYRQVTKLEEFRRAVEKAIGEVQNSVGVTIEPSFMWESHALRPQPAYICEGIFVAADLGGGSLDLYAAMYRKVGNRWVIGEEIIDSARVGADYLVQSWSAAQQFTTPEAILKGRHETAVYKAAIRSGDIDTEALHSANDTQYARTYWITIRNYIAVWCDAVAKHWATQQTAPNITFQRLGLGWELYDRAGLAPWTETMNGTASVLGLSVRFTEETAARDGRSRKEELAYRALWRTEDAAESIEALKRTQPNMVVGIEMEVGGAVQPPHTLLRDVIPVANGMRPTNLAAAQKLLGASPAVIEYVIARLNKGEREGGIITTAGGVNRLALSPLTLIAERLIDDSDAR